MFRKLMQSRKIRTRTSWILAFVLVPPFIFFFHMFSSPTQQSGPSGPAGMVFGKAVSWDLYRQQYAATRRQWQSQLVEAGGKAVELAPALEPLVVQATWDRLIILREAQRTRLRISDEALAGWIHRDPLFQVNGLFLPERYEQYVSAIGMTPRVFEGFLRDQLLVQQLIQDVRRSVTVGDGEVREVFVKANERLRAAMIVVDPASFEADVRRDITGDVLQADYEARPALVETPPQITFEYVGLSRDQLTETLVILEEELLDFYEGRPDDFLDEDGQPRLFADVREEIRRRLLPRQISRRLNLLALDLEEAVDAGRPFEELAMEFELSTHTIGPIPSGDLGAAGVPEPALLQAAFALDERQRSEIIETDDGVYLIQFVRRNPSQVPPFEDVRDTIQERLISERSREAARASADDLRTRLRDRMAAGETIEAAAATLGVALLQPAPFTRTEAIGPIGMVPSLTRAAFETAVGELTDVVETLEGFILLAPLERLAPDDTAFPEQETPLRQRLLAAKRDARLAQWIADLRTRAKLKTFVEPSIPDPGRLP